MKGNWSLKAFEFKHLKESTALHNIGMVIIICKLPVSFLFLAMGGNTIPLALLKPDINQS